MTGHVVLHSLDTRDSHAKSMLVQLACLVSARRQRQKIAGTERMLLLGPLFFRVGPRLIGRTFGVGSAYYRRAVHRQSIYATRPLTNAVLRHGGQLQLCLRWRLTRMERI